MDKILKLIPQIDICIIAKEFIGLLIFPPPAPAICIMCKNSTFETTGRLTRVVKR